MGGDNLHNVSLQAPLLKKLHLDATIKYLEN